jgi:cell division protein ZapA
MSQQHLEITIADRTLKVACPTGQESALIAAAGELNTRILKANTSTMITTPEQSLLMTAVNLSHDLIAAQEQIRHERKAYQSKINLLKSTIERAMLESREKQS